MFTSTAFTYLVILLKVAYQGKQLKRGPVFLQRSVGRSVRAEQINFVT